VLIKEGYMNNLSSHYETLNVSKDSSKEEIRASYITLCKLFQSESVMIEELTKSYEVLKNLNQTVIEQLPALPTAVVETETTSKLLEFASRQRETLKPEEGGFSSRIVAAVAAIALVGGIALAITSPSSIITRLRITTPTDIIAKTSYVRPTMAPNQTPFPETTSYLAGYEIKNNQGGSSLYVDNTKNENDVYLKLLSVKGHMVTTVRHVLIKGKTDFKLENLTAGNYEVQYLDLVAGLAGRSIVFSVEDKATEFGVRSSTLGVKLKTQTNGTMSVENVSIDEFNSLASL
jgi:hypothetical protein